MKIIGDLGELAVSDIVNVSIDVVSGMCMGEHLTGLTVALTDCSTGLELSPLGRTAPTAKGNNMSFWVQATGIGHGKILVTFEGSLGTRLTQCVLYRVQ